MNINELIVDVMEYDKKGEKNKIEHCVDIFKII
jgi:hypothetical protein